MDLRIRKDKLIQEIDQLSEDQLLAIENLIAEENNLDTHLDRALAQVRKGELRPHEEVRRKYEKWLGK